MHDRNILVIILLLVAAGTLAVRVNFNVAKAFGTIYIRSDGRIDPETANISRIGDTYFLTNNVYDSVVIEKSNIALDGAGYTIQGNFVGYGITLYNISNVRVENIHIRDFLVGIHCNLTSSIHILNNSVTGNNDTGIWIWSSEDAVVSENRVNSNLGGIYLGEEASFNYRINVSNNEIADNSYIGLMLTCASDCVLSQNNIHNNKYNLAIWGTEPAQYMHSIDSSNMVDGKPVYYLIDKRDIVLSPVTTPEVGYLALVNCVNVTVEYLSLANNGQGIMLSCTNNSVMKRNTITNTTAGFRIHWSFGNTICENVVTESKWQAVYLLKQSSNNTVVGNDLRRCKHGVFLYQAFDNEIFRNTIAENMYGICAHHSPGNLIYHNNFVNNSHQIPTTTDEWFQASIWNNAWDIGYPCGGNYWSDYSGVDLYCGSFQNMLGSDGIGDTPYMLDGRALDNYPLVSLYYQSLCDLNTDGVVNILDITLVAAAYNSKPGDLKWNELADLDKNGIINIIDVTMVAREYGKVI